MREESAATPSPLRCRSAQGRPASTEARWAACPVVRQHPNAASLVLTRRTVSAAGYPPAERLIESLGRAGLSDLNLLAAFRAVLSLVMGATQVELAGPLATAHRDQSNAAVAKRIGELAGAEHPHMAALAKTSQRSTMAADFDRALDMLLAGIKTHATPRK